MKENNQAPLDDEVEKEIREILVSRFSPLNGTTNVKIEYATKEIAGLVQKAEERGRNQVEKQLGIKNRKEIEMFLKKYPLLESK